MGFELFLCFAAQVTRVYSPLKKFINRIERFKKSFFNAAGNESVFGYSILRGSEEWNCFKIYNWEKNEIDILIYFLNKEWHNVGDGLTIRAVSGKQFHRIHQNFRPSCIVPERVVLLLFFSVIIVIWSSRSAKKKKSDERPWSYSSVRVKKLQYTAHKPCARFWLINLYSYFHGKN